MSKKRLNEEELMLFLKGSLEEARNIMNRFQIGINETRKKIIAKNFQNEILTFLDYMYTNFPVDRDLLGDYFPRPYLSESSSEYYERIRQFNKGKQLIKHPKKVIDFLLNFYEINKKYQYAISYIQSKVKHETPNKFKEESIGVLNAELVSNHPKPIQYLPDGSINVGGFTFKKGSHVVIKNSIFSLGDFSTHIEKLEFKEVKMLGDKIIFNDGTELVFKNWASNCIDICTESLIKYKENF